MPDDGRTEAPQASGAAEAGSPVLKQNDDGVVRGVADTEPTDANLPQVGRHVRKVGFIINDTIESAIKQAHETARLLKKGGVNVVESHSASPETSVNWTRDDHLDL